MPKRKNVVGATLVCCVFGLGAAGCGDAPSPDARGYTKAPLEKAGMMVTPEEGTVMDELGEPVLPRPSFTPPAPPGEEEEGG